MSIDDAAPRLTRREFAAAMLMTVGWLIVPPGRPRMRPNACSRVELCAH